jgi:mitochondrial import inner membrane translocase subunit TIM44
MTGNILENNVYVLIVTFDTQELMLFRNAKSGEIVIGSEDKVEQCRYAAIITRVEEDLNNELTGGWKIVEVWVSCSAN